MRLTQRGQRLALGLAASAAFTAGLTAQHWDPITRQLDACHTVTLAEYVAGTGETEQRAQQLLAAGWTGDPTDHAERLYSPACRR